MAFDRSKIPHREWDFEDTEWRYGVVLDPNEGITFWGEHHNGEDAGAYGMSFRDFLGTKDFRSTPADVISEIREILLAAKTS